MSNITHQEFQRIIEKYERQIHAYCRKYYGGIMPYDDFVQELKIKLWETLDKHYSSAIGPLDNYVCGVLKLESKKLRTDSPAQKKFEEAMLITAEPIYFEGHHGESRNYENFIDKIQLSLTTSESRLFNMIISRVDSSLPIRYNILASTMGVNLYDLNKIMSRLRNRVSVFIKNEQYF